MQIPRVAIVAAAGMGVRLGLKTPKPLVEISGRSVLSRQLDLLSCFEEVRFVVGFDEHKIISEVLKIRPDSIFVRNPDFISTGSADSFAIATKELREPALLIDGDTLVKPKSFKEFLGRYSPGKDLAGVTPVKTSNPVCVHLSSNSQFVTGFTTSHETDFEWCGLVILKAPAEIELSYHRGYLYKHLESLLPLSCHIVQAEEIDTQADLARARAAVVGWY